MNSRGKFNIVLLCAASIMAPASKAFAQTTSAPVEAVTVTGSRVISDPLSSPTALTVVSTAELQATTPSNIADGLNKLPISQNSNAPNSTYASSNTGTSAINALNLRNFGPQRTLVLLDGRRVIPAEPNGVVDIDNLPEPLTSSVEVVTGGASAVYGSDAVTGVVNYILDKHFNGFKVDANAGISNYGDALSYKFTAAGGTDLFGGRGHIEMSYRHFSADPVNDLARPDGPKYLDLTGSGTAAKPFVDTINTRNSNSSPNGLIFNCATPTGVQCPVNGFQFVSNGVLGPFFAGTPTGSAGLSSGGDGAFTINSGAFAAQRNDTAFGRVSYDLDEGTSIWMNVTMSDGHQVSIFQDSNVSGNSANTPNTYFTNNAFLTPATQAQFGTATTFQLAKQIHELGEAGGRANTDTRQLSFTVGADGKLGVALDWDVYYTHGNSRLSKRYDNNFNSQKLYAAQDAVLSNGQVVCQVSTTAFASLYPGCVPINPFGPTTVTSGMYRYVADTTQQIFMYGMDDVGGSISGNIFELPAGPVKAALTAESRWVAYDVQSNPANANDNCTGLRICSPAAVLYGTAAGAGPQNSSLNVYEFSGEAGIPVIKNAPFVQELNVNIAGRYTNYSTSGAAETWKIGAEWQVSDDLRLRATNSIDIRAPTLTDLYTPPTQSSFGLTDIHTNTTGTSQQLVTSNPNLVPEVARTYTAGIVLTPRLLPGFSTSLDYYRIGLKNAIGTISGRDTAVLTLCELANGTGPFCALYTRPLPFSNRTPANFPTLVLIQGVNTSVSKLEGWDFETNYHFELSDILDGANGSISLRGLATYQPVNEQQTFPTAPYVYCDTGNVGCKPKTRGTLLVNYTLNDWSFGLLNRWYGGFNRAAQPNLIYATPRVKSYDMVDITITRSFTIDHGMLDAYLNVQNVGNSPESRDVIFSAAPQQYLPVWNGADVMGRYFTIGLRANL
jgi:iron complex outermembrane receptor protein